MVKICGPTAFQRQYCIFIVKAFNNYTSLTLKMKMKDSDDFG